jgi:signal transduction histidine kinase
VTRDEAIHTLTSSSSHERLKAARFLAQNAHPGDLQVLKRVRQAESVSYVKRSLDTAIARASNVPSIVQSDPSGEFDVPEDIRRQIMNRAVETVTGLLLHEIASPIGLVRKAASDEIPDFEHSRTKRYLDNVDRIWDGIYQLKSASTSPKSEEFDLAGFLEEIIISETIGEKIDVSLHGPKPMLIMSDSRLLQLAICNGVRNAVEAVIESGSNEPHAIVVTWGETDVDYWITVIDRGPGVVGPIEPAFEIGKTTKQGHSGFGLAIARQAMETLSGHVTLQPAVSGGTRYDLRWAR